MEAQPIKPAMNDEFDAPVSLRALLREDVASVFKRDPAARTTLEVILTYPGVHAIIWHRLAHRLWKREWRFSARLLAYLGRLLTNVDIHPGATIGRRFFIDHGSGVVIGETAIVGNDVTLYHGVTLGGTTWNKGRRHPTLGNRVLIGAGAKVLGPITLADDVRVGANSVVVKDVTAGKTVIGIPGKEVNMGKRDANNALGIDLDHHLIPDPVGKAIGCLMERIELLEQRLTEHGIPVCRSCEGGAVCEEPQHRPVMNMTEQRDGSARL